MSQQQNSTRTDSPPPAISGDDAELLARLVGDANQEPTEIKSDPITNFWTVYKKVADEHDNNLISKCTGNLKISLLFGGLYLVVVATVIAQISSQPQQETASDRTNPPAPLSKTSIKIALTLWILSLSISLFVVLIALLWKQWLLHYTQVTTQGNIVDQGKERHAMIMQLQEWKIHVVIGSLPVMLLFAVLLFGTALAFYLWDLYFFVVEARLG